ncbi:MAG: prepilin-type N-terminal cleavage/methylation domain-containing protein [Rickettsiales bacterium]
MRRTLLSSGFSLLEMAVSLTVIALIVAALTVTQQIKTRLELNRVIDDRARLEEALTSFSTQYSALPGDFWNAAAIFGADKTKGGNGNSLLEKDAENGDETLLFWQHLQLAGLIEGTYDGTTDGQGGRMAASVPKAFYGAGTEDYWGDTENAPYVVAERPSGGGAFSPAQAYDYDTRYDDQNPLAGTIRARDPEGEENACISVAGKYRLDNESDRACRLYFLR